MQIRNIITKIMFPKEKKGRMIEAGGKGNLRLVRRE